MKRLPVIAVLVGTLLLCLFAAQARAAGAPPQLVRTAPNGQHLLPRKRQAARRLADFWAPVVISTPTQCGSRVMQPFMPNVTTTGAAWTFWWPQIDSNTYAYLTGVGGNAYASGPLFAQNQSTGQQFWQDSAGTWHAVSNAATTVSPPLGQRVSYGVDDWLEFVFPNGSSSGWIENGLRTTGYTGPNAFGGLGILYDQYGLPTAAGAFGCIY